ncbi:MAG: hypothetical protein AB2693_26340, partial [Candidatus Thiodiazotropha sp.]
ALTVNVFIKQSFKTARLHHWAKTFLYFSRQNDQNYQKPYPKLVNHVYTDNQHKYGPENRRVIMTLLRVVE